MRAYLALKKEGQAMSGYLAAALKTSERSLNVELYPHIVRGEVMSCRVFDGNGKFVGTQYRISGHIPASRPGPKLGPRPKGE